MKRPKRSQRPTRRRRRSKTNAGRWVRLSWYEDNYSGYDIELILRHRGVKVRDRTWEERGETKVLSLSVPAGQKRWAEEIVFVQNAQAPAMDLRKLEPATRRRIDEREPYELKRKFRKTAVRSGGGPINRITEALLDIMAIASSAHDPHRDPNRDRRKNNHAIT